MYLRSLTVVVSLYEEENMSSQALRIVFMGTPDFAATSLRALIDGPDQVVAVVTQPDRAKGRGKKRSPPPVKILAEELQIPVLQPRDIRTRDFHNGLLTYQPDLLVVVAYGKMLPKNLLDLAPLGCINVHGSLLPKYRGAAPVQWTVINRDTEAGVTIIQMDEGLDTGGILLRASIRTDPGETSGSLFVKLADLGSRILLEAVKGIKEGTLVPQPQEHGQASMAPMFKKADGYIDWRASAEELEGRIRGLDPWPSAFCFWEKKRLRLFAPEVVFQDAEAAPGTVIRADKAGILVACGQNCLLIHEIQPEGKSRMSAEAFVCGSRLSQGASLADPQRS